ncbi:hypothetical protein TCAL_02321 [Tigriopus californicus]|uniref:CUB domain-containing protein n=1 Tax=Tigriopus californicus TaxID=6832 RepID=A0A553NYU9_TIGCA|nr:hypothetical protein TCAL_02321 [Tigriopus californicus]
MSHPNPEVVENDACNPGGSSGRMGTCYTVDECSRRMSLSCGGSSSDNCTYLTESMSPGSVMECQYEICKCAPDVCRIRLDFLQHTLVGPVIGTTESGIEDSGNAIGDCITDTFSVKNPRAKSPPDICGFNNGQHMIYDMASPCSSLDFVLGGGGQARNWDIKATHLSRQTYSMCIRREAGMCAICYIPAIIPLVEAADDQASFGLNKGEDAAVDTECRDDYIQIPFGETVDAIEGGPGIQLFCGRAFNVDTAATVPASVCSSHLPFQIHYVTTQNEVDKGKNNEMINFPGGIVGFSLDYRQVPDIMLSLGASIFVVQVLVLVSAIEPDHLVPETNGTSRSGKGGESSGTCANGYGVCCIMSLACGGTSSTNCTYLSQPNGVNMMIPNPCQYTICKAHDDICRVRLDFMTFSIAGPQVGTTSDTGLLDVGDAIGDCLTDSFQVALGEGASPGEICGFNTGQHMIYEPSDLCDELSFILGGGVSMNREWDIKVTQYKCGEENVAATHLSRQGYNVCIRRQPGACAICYVPSIVVDPATPEDQIPLAEEFPVADPTEIGKQLICGRIFSVIDGSTVPTSVCSTSVPFILGVSTGGDEFTAKADPAKNELMMAPAPPVPLKSNLNHMPSNAYEEMGPSWIIHLLPKEDDNDTEGRETTQRKIRQWRY